MATVPCCRQHRTPRPRCDYRIDDCGCDLFGRNASAFIGVEMFEHRRRLRIGRTLLEVFRPSQSDARGDRARFDGAHPTPKGTAPAVPPWRKHAEPPSPPNTNCGGPREAGEHRPDHDDASPAACTHSGQNQLAQPDRSEHIRAEEPLDGLGRQLFERTGLALTGIVDEHIDAVEQAEIPKFLCQRVRTCGVGQIESQIPDAGDPLGRFEAVGVPAGRQYRAALRCQRLGDGSADSRGAAGDEDGEFSTSHVSSPPQRQRGRRAGRRRCTRRGRCPRARCSRAFRRRRNRSPRRPHTGRGSVC